MRLFLGIDLPTQQKEQLYKSVIPLIKKYPNYNWVHPDTYHATLQFYGEVDDVRELETRIDQVLYDKEKFYLYGRGVDLFPAQELHRPHVLPCRRAASDTGGATPFSSNERAARDAREYVTRPRRCTFSMPMRVAGNRVSL